MIFIYIIILLILVFCINKNLDQSKYFSYLIYGIEILLILSCSFRIIYANSNNDTYTYMIMYNNSMTKSLVQMKQIYPGIETGFLVLIKMFSMLNIPYRIFLVFTSFISIGGIFYFINKNSKNIIFSLFLFLCLGSYFFAFTAIRQSLSIGIVFFGIHYLYKNKVILFVFFVLIASLFHLTSLIYLILLLDRYISKKIVLIISIMCIAVLFIPQEFLSVIFGYKYSLYFPKLISISLNNIGQIIFLIGIFVSALYYSGEYKNKKLMSKYYPSFIYCLIHLLSLRTNMFSRLSLNFQPLYVSNLSDLNELITNKKYKILICISVLLYHLAWLYLNKSMNFL